MLTTGILSLNIHDSLTFEGTELCLNPDLFSVQHGTVKRTASTAGPHGVSNEDPQPRGIGSSSTNSGNSGNTSQHSTNTPLAVGDMVEIRVWDPLPKEAAAASAASVKSPSSSGVVRKGVLTRQSSQPTPLAPVIPVPVSSSATVTGAVDIPTASRGNNLEGGTGTSVPSLVPRAEEFSEIKDISDSGSLGAKSKAHSMEGGTNEVSNTQQAIKPTFSDDDPPPPPQTIDELTSLAASTSVANNNTSATPPMHHQQSLPPVFPRARPGVGSADHAPLPSTPVSKPLKPSIIHRRVVSSAGAIPIRSPKQQQHHQQPLSSRHVRDISDMTVDTHQLDIAGTLLQQTESHDMMSGSEDMIETANEASLLKISSTHRLRLSFVLKATEKTFTSFKGNSRTQISMLRQVADLYNLSTYDLVTVHKIEAQDEEEVLNAVSADFVVVTIKDQFISRGDMLLFQTQLVGSWIYEGERLTESTRGIKAHAREIRHGNYSAKSGIVTDKTMITFRSRSARIIWLVQLSEEMVRIKNPNADCTWPNIVHSWQLIVFAFLNSGN
jgi:Vacuolar membrane-associated protein Iml1